jgi:hypothetical protein
MATGLSQDERRAVAQRIFAALCTHYPKHYIALIECKADASVRVEPDARPTRNL